MPQQSRIGILAILLFTPYLLLLDVIDILLLFLGLDDFWILDLLSFPVTQFYLRWKSARSTYNLVGNLLELIPYVGKLPWRTVGFLLTVWATNRAARKAALEGAQAIAQGVPAQRGTPPTPAGAPSAAAGSVAPARTSAGAGSAARVLRY